MTTELNITSIKFFTNKPGTPFLGAASVTFNELPFSIRITIGENSKGLYAMWPSYKVGEKYNDYCYFEDLDVKKSINAEILEAWEAQKDSAPKTVKKAVATAKPAVGTKKTAAPNFGEDEMPF